ncbi:hypothetical protein KVR01_005746 [Diaporthe batatas]|uniref:uncharacterized protein n=1 Tax=Diaporthe batatas TaxID=748121 RepID=UPI001D04EF9B|nr:uncharacterized protein KVR01_005746 [Diaporthe batatas]KAG8163828.1 hypothetical protein KVR01_005746 [Diaporthe batatas]
MAGRKRRDSGPVAAPAEPNRRASDATSQPRDEEATQCTETDSERRRNIEACLNYINENGYPPAHAHSVTVTLCPFSSMLS